MNAAHYAPNSFCWLDLATSDQAAARTFYTALFGWTPQEIPVEGEGTYTALRLGEAVVAGLFAIDDHMRSQGVEPHWLSYVSVPEVDVSTARAADLGATVMAGPVDAKGQARMSVIRDPEGAFLGLWQPRLFAGSEVHGVPGSFVWNELMTHDPDAAVRFYGELFGWQTRTVAGAVGPYTHFVSGGHRVAGMIRIRPEWGEVPTNWSLYFAVEDVDAAVARAEELGGHRETPIMEVPQAGRFVLVRDAQGAHFELMQGA